MMQIFFFNIYIDVMKKNKEMHDMDNLTLGIIIGAVCAFIVSLLIVLPLLKKRGIPISSLISSANHVLIGTDQAIHSAEIVLPPIPALFVVDKIIEWAQVAVNFADQIYNSGKIDKDQRKDEALCFLRNAIISSGMEITPEIQKLDQSKRA
jgi:hypothetical protein